MEAENATLIVGAGPTGLTLAIELQRAGLPFRLIDKSDVPAQHSQALGVQSRTLEQFERYGIADQFITRGRQAHRFAATSDGKPLVSLDFEKIPGRYPFVLAIPQTVTESILTDYLARRGGRVERGVELIQCENGLDGVRTTLAHKTGRVERFTAAWLAGCDGARSKVREAIGIPFAGETEPLHFFLADLQLSGPNLPAEDLRVYLHEGRALFIGHWSEKLWRLVIVSHNDATSPAAPALADFQRALDEFVGGGITAANPIWMAPFHVHERMVDHYRTDNIFLAGDAAHIHSPLAGQGMNTGIQDAANLGWKLAAVHRGADPNLLSSYEEERSAVGKSVLKATSEGLSALTTTNPLLTWLRDLLLPIATQWPLVQRAALGFISETALDYRDSSIVRETVYSGFLRAGDRAPNPEIHFRQHKPQRMLECLKDDAHLAIGINVKDEAAFAHALPASPHLFLTTRATDSIRAGWSDTALVELFGDESQIILVRPDGYIGLRCREGDAESLEYYGQLVGLPALLLTS
jgi:2-polyprenyl-6-methoxyphenol hydroxylase-like FAD-dependent oxidoreductase